MALPTHPPTIDDVMLDEMYGGEIFGAWSPHYLVESQSGALPPFVAHVVAYLEYGREFQVASVSETSWGWSMNFEVPGGQVWVLCREAPHCAGLWRAMPVARHDQRVGWENSTRLAASIDVICAILRKATEDVPDRWTSEQPPPGWKKPLRVPGKWPVRLAKCEYPWARSHVRTELREWAKNPADGELWESIEDVRVEYSIYYRAPGSGGGSGLLPAGTRVRVEICDSSLGPKAFAVLSDGSENTNLEQLFVPADVQANVVYAGFQVSVDKRTFDLKFRQVAPQC